MFGPLTCDKLYLCEYAALDLRVSNLSTDWNVEFRYLVEHGHSTRHHINTLPFHLKLTNANQVLNGIGLQHFNSFTSHYFMLDMTPIKPRSNVDIFQQLHFDTAEIITCSIVVIGPRPTHLQVLDLYYLDIPSPNATILSKTLWQSALLSTYPHFNCRLHMLTPSLVMTTKAMLNVWGQQQTNPTHLLYPQAARWTIT